MSTNTRYKYSAGRKNLARRGTCTCTWSPTHFTHITVCRIHMVDFYSPAWRWDLRSCWNLEECSALPSSSGMLIACPLGVRVRGTPVQYYKLRVFIVHWSTNRVVLCLVLVVVLYFSDTPWRVLYAWVPVTCIITVVWILLSTVRFCTVDYDVTRFTMATEQWLSRMNIQRVPATIVQEGTVPSSWIVGEHSPLQHRHCIWHLSITAYVKNSIGVVPYYKVTGNPSRLWLRSF